MNEQTYHIRKTIDVAVVAPVGLSQSDVDDWVSHNLKIGNTLENDTAVKDICIIDGEDDQDNYLVVSWPESQELCEYEGYLENCTFVMGEDLPCCSYLVRKDWYSRLKNGDLKKMELYEEAV